GLQVPSFGQFCIVAGRIQASYNWRIVLPNALALERELGEILYLLISSDAEILLRALRANLQPVASVLKLPAEGADEPAFFVENENGWVIREILASLMDDVEQPGGIYSDVVSRLPRILVRQLRPIMEHFILVLPGTDHQ